MPCRRAPLRRAPCALPASRLPPWRLTPRAAARPPGPRPAVHPLPSRRAAPTRAELSAPLRTFRRPTRAAPWHKTRGPNARDAAARNAGLVPNLARARARPTRSERTPRPGVNPGATVCKTRRRGPRADLSMSRRTLRRQGLYWVAPGFTPGRGRSSARGRNAQCEVVEERSERGREYCAARDGGRTHGTRPRGKCGERGGGGTRGTRPRGLRRATQWRDARDAAEREVRRARWGRDARDAAERERARGSGEREVGAGGSSGLLGMPSPALPVARPPPCVRDRHDKNTRRLVAIENGIREPTKSNSSQSKEDRPAVWRLNDERKRRFEFIGKARGNARIARCVPGRRVLALGDGEGMELKGLHDDRAPQREGDDEPRSRELSSPSPHQSRPVGARLPGPRPPRRPHPGDRLRRGYPATQRRLLRAGPAAVAAQRRVRSRCHSWPNSTPCSRGGRAASIRHGPP